MCVCMWVGCTERIAHPHQLTHHSPRTATNHDNDSITLRSADELAVAWAVPADPLLRDRHDASAYKLEIRAADCHW